MPKTQKELFQIEDEILASYAIKSSQSKGRVYEEQADPYRTPFQRDRDRVIHSKAFRRLNGKTQVFVSGHGDHYRTRLTHSMEVAQVSRDIARSLGLNEDLCEVIALAHDLGHTPFGHAGEEAMAELMAEYDDHFEHNEQSRRIVEHLEHKSTKFPGLNLTVETLEGLMKHRELHDDGVTPVVHSLEAQVVDLADAIAYHHHDLDDGLRSGILSYDDLEQEAEIWRQAIEGHNRKKMTEELYRHIAINHVISILINDLTDTTAKRIRDKKIIMPLDSPMSLVDFSPRMRERTDQLAEFLGDRFYLHSDVITEHVQGQHIIQRLFESYMQDEDLLPPSAKSFLEAYPRHVVVKDYIAGMTDEYALKRFQEL